MSISSPNAVGSDSRLVKILDGYLAALQAGNPPNKDALLAQHPGLAEDLEACLASLDFIRTAGLAPADNSATNEPDLPLRVLGDFRLIREIGRGGMGVVYEAHQLSLKRRVALKVLPFAAVLDPRQLQRFQNEAQAAACLEHPHIVPVYGVGCERGVHYYAMKFIDGESLGVLIESQRHSSDPQPSSQSRPEGSREHHPLPDDRGSRPTTPIAAFSTQPAPRDAAAFGQIALWGIQAAEALEYAHSLGIVHRDIKPANLIIDGQGKLWVADFGLARTGTDAGLTMTGDILGTLRYMSPEQALAKHGLVDHRTDVYSLGVTLYELLTLEPAFPGKDREEVLRRIAFEEVRLPRRVNNLVPAELETVLLKALAKEPGDRYATAQMLADDLQCYLEHKPIRARRPGLADRMAKWARRHRQLVLAGAASLGLAIVGLTVGIVRVAQAQAETARARDLVLARERSLREILYFQDVRLAWQAWQNGELVQMRKLLDRHEPETGQEDLPGFEWSYLRRRSHGVLREVARVSAHQGDAHCVAYSRDGRVLASGGKDGMIRLWDVATLRQEAAWASSQVEVNEVAFAPDGKTLASAGDDRTVRLWHLPDHRQQAVLVPKGGSHHELSALGYSPDGKIVAAGGQNGWVWSWDAASGGPRAAFDLKSSGINYLAFAPDGLSLAASAGGRIFLLDPATLRELRQFIHPFGGTLSVAFSRDGLTVASGSHFDDHIVLWDLKTGTTRLLLRGHDVNIRCLAFSPDDRLLASGDDARVSLWDSRTGTLQDSVAGHDGRVWCTTFSPDGKRLATAGIDGAIKLWDVRRDDRRIFPLAKGQRPLSWYAHNDVLLRWAAFAPGRQTVLTWATSGALQRWDALSGRHEQSPREPAFSFVSPALAPAGRLVTVGVDGRDLQVWDPSPAAAQVYRHGRPISGVAISPDGKNVAFSDYASPADLWLWKVGSLQPRCLYRLTVPSWRLAFTPDGRTLTVADSSRVVLLELTDGRVAAILSGHAAVVVGLAFSPDGRLLATCSADGTVRIWDYPTGQERSCLRHSRNGVQTVAFSPDGKTLASDGTDGKVILWNVAQGEELMTFDGSVSAVVFSPDGKILAGGGKELTLWYGEGVQAEPGE
jgi:WD40 repeat protein/serine/threonine protein kinase